MRRGVGAVGVDQDSTKKRPSDVTPQQTNHARVSDQDLKGKKVTSTNGKFMGI
jgi:hypothetical protein